MGISVKFVFPVRFRRDGKDGVNVWLKYASVLDKYDSNTDKHYPSNKYMSDEPTEDCKYIGIGKGVGDEPNSGEYYEWKKYIGDDGTSFTAKGQAVAHHASLSDYDSATKSKGFHLIDDSAGALLKYWNGTTTENRSVTDGDAYTTADKHLWVKDGAKWNDLGEIQGPKGDPAYLDTIYLKGASYSSSGTPSAVVKVTKDGVSSTLQANSRGLTAYKINRTTLAVTKIGTFDTYNSSTGAAAANNLATAISSLDTTVFLAIASFDACGFTTNLLNALLQFGGSDIADLTAKSRAFCFLGYKGMVTGTAQQLDYAGNDKIAEISSIVTDGVCQGGGQNGNSVVRLDLTNENDTMLYDELGNNVSGSSECEARLYSGDNLVALTSGMVVATATDCTITTAQSSNYYKVTVSAMSANQATVKFVATYKGVSYQSVMTLKKIVGTAKYEIITTPTAVTFNPNTKTYSHAGITVDIYRTTQKYGRQLNPGDLRGEIFWKSGSSSGIRSAGGIVSSDYFSGNEVIFEYIEDGDTKDLETVPIIQEGQNGSAGNSVKNITNKYLAKSTADTPSKTSSLWKDNPSDTDFSSTNKYLWNYETITYTQSSQTTTDPRIIAVWGEQGVKGNGISSITEYYLATSSNSGITTSTSGWDKEVQSITPSKKYLWNYEEITYTEGNSTCSTPCIIGVYGDQGLPGNDAVTYKLNSSIVSIPLNNEGYPSVTSFTLTPKMSVGNTSGKFNSEYTMVVYISHSGSTSPVIASYTLDENTKSVSVYLTSNGGSTGTMLKDITSVTCSLYHGQSSLDSFTILPVKAGAAGVSYFPNMCGVWDGANTTYKWTNGSRDMVTYYISGTPYLFAVKTAGTTISASANNATPDKDSRWEKADSPFSMLFANFVYTDNASVAGFVWSEEQMMSSSFTGSSLSADTANIYMNGKKGFFRALNAEIQGKIIAKSGTFSNCIIDKSCEIHNENGWNLLGDSTGPGWILKGIGSLPINFSIEGTNYSVTMHNGVGAGGGVNAAHMIQCRGYNGIIINAEGTALDVNTGQSIFRNNVTMSGSITSISGLRISTYTMSSNGTIPTNVELVTFTNSSAITVGLPSASGCKGKVLYLKKLGSGSVTLSGSSSNLIVGAGGTGTSTTSGNVGNSKSMMYISDGKYWIEFYCG